MSDTTKKSPMLKMLEKQAYLGNTSVKLILWKSQVKMLRRIGFEVKRLARRDNRDLYLISWANPTNSDSLAAKMLELSIEAREKEVCSL